MKSLFAAVLLIFPIGASATGDAPFCVYSNGPAQCFYYSIESCRSAAATLNGMCAPNNQSQQPQAMQYQSRQQPTVQAPNIIESMQQGFELGAQQRRARQEAEAHAAQMELMQLQAQALKQQQEASLPPPRYYLCPDLDDGSRYHRSEQDGLGCAPVR